MAKKFRMTEEEDRTPEKSTPVVAQYWKADLELERISKYTVRYLVKNPSGMKLQNLSTVEIDRSEFPKDYNFSLDFINSDIPALARSGDKDAAEGVAKLLTKQADFRRFKHLKIYILAE